MSGSFSYAIWARDQYGRAAIFVPPQPEFLKGERVEMLKQSRETENLAVRCGRTDSARGAGVEAGGVIRLGQLKVADEHSLCYWHVNAFWAKKISRVICRKKNKAPLLDFASNGA
jgi:hypothetical protein